MSCTYFLTIYIYVYIVTLTSAHCDTVSQRAEVSVALTVIALCLQYWALYFR